MKKKNGVMIMALVGNKKKKVAGANIFGKDVGECLHQPMCLRMTTILNKNKFIIQIII
jgi:hypothetical protein